MKTFRKFRSKKKRLSSKYVLMILTGFCVVTLFISLVFNISGGPLNVVAGYVFVPMQKGINEAGSWISDKAHDFKTLGEVLKENKELKYMKLRDEAGVLVHEPRCTELAEFGG